MSLLVIILFVLRSIVAKRIMRKPLMIASFIRSFSLSRYICTAVRCVITVGDNVHANHLLLDSPAEWLHPLQLATLGQGTCIMQVILRSAVTIHRKHCKVIGPYYVPQ